LNEKQKETDDEMPILFTFYSSGIKEGKNGFACSHCKDLLIDAIQTWASVCQIAEDTSPYQIVSPFSSRYKER